MWGTETALQSLYMLRRILPVLLIAFVAAAVPCLAQSSASQNPADMPNQPPPRSDDRSPSESSSKDTRIDLSPPAFDEKNHPNSGVADDILELHPYDPHRAEKNIEIGDYYFKLKNYRAAESRYAEALEYKPNDAEATYKLGTTQENLGEKIEALASYQGYLKILPEGPHAAEAKKGIDRLNNPSTSEAKEGKKDKKKKGK